MSPRWRLRRRMPCGPDPAWLQGWRFGVGRLAGWRGPDSETGRSNALPERERRILELRFGFEGEPWTLEAIGHELDLTRERVRQLEAQALARLAALRDLSAVATN